MRSWDSTTAAGLEGVSSISSLVPRLRQELQTLIPLFLLMMMAITSFIDCLLCAQPP